MGSVLEYNDRSILTESEKKKHDSFGSSKRQKEFLGVRGIIREAAKQTGLKPDLFTIKKNAAGKPFADYYGVRHHISIAHTHKKVFCAVSSDLSVGVDIERKDRPVSSDLRDRMMDAYENRLLKAVNTLRIWTIKEALIKLDGKKLGVDLKKCVITGRESDIYFAEINGRMTAKVLSCKYKNYWLAVAF